MTRQNLICILAVCAVFSGHSMTTASAQESARKDTAAQSSETPMKLRTYMRKPVATSATRTVKKKNGTYAKTAVKRRAKQQTAQQPANAAPPVSPATLSPAAAQALASYEVARVRVVTPETTGLATPLHESTEMIVGVDSVQVVSAEEVNDIDRQADTGTAVSLDALSRDLAGSGGLRDFAAVAEPKPAEDSWFSRILTMFSGAFTSVATLLRTLLA